MPLRRDRCYHAGQSVADKPGASVMKQELLTVIGACFPDILRLNGDLEGFKGLAAWLIGMLLFDQHHSHTRAHGTP